MYHAFSAFCSNQNEKINLCGLSLGEILILDFVKKNPEKVNSMILISTPYKIFKTLFKVQSLILCGNKDNLNIESSKLLNDSIKNVNLK